MDLEHKAIARLREASRMSIQHYGKPLLVTTSGGKDSSVCLALAERAGIPYEVLHHHTTVDAPETVYFVRNEFRRLEENGVKCDVSYPAYKGAPVSMWSLIPQKLIPPTRLVRYCSDVLKEHSGKGRFVITGVRWAESAKRKNNRGIFETMPSNRKKKVILADDANDKRVLFTAAGPKVKRVCNPIIDWENSDVWSYIRAERIPVNPLYSCGFHRVGCVGCPMASAGRWKEFARYPQYQVMYLRAFDRMIAERRRRELPSPWPPIIDDELFEKAQLRCQKTAASSPKIGRAPKHLLSGILRCPQCGSAMIAEHSGWQNRGGEKKEVLNYQCGHHAGARGGQCKKNAIRADWVETEVIEYTKQLIQNPQFAADIQAQIGQQSDGAELDAEIEGYRKHLKKLEVSKANLERDIDNIVDGDRNAERKRKDMNARLDKLYDEIYELENQISSREQKKLAIKQNMLTLETVHNMLGVFDKIFDVMDAADKRKVMETLVAEVQLHPKATWKEGQNHIKSIKYTFPIYPEVLKTFGCNCKNEVTGTPAGTPLQGAVYEISDPRSNKVVEYITTDARGIAASRPLPLGRYKIKEVTAPAYWQVSGTTFDETLEYSGVRFVP